MNSTELIALLERCIEENIKDPMFIWGPPGGGKSSIVKAIARAHGLVLVDLRLNQIPPADLRGLPMLKGEEAAYARPEWLRPDGQGIIFLDELPNAVPTVQGLAQQLLLDRCVGEHKLGDGWFVWGAGNRREDGAAVHAMPSPVANRMLHVELESDYVSWKHHGIQAGFHEHILSFVAFRPELLYKPDRNAPAFPSPRTWEMASRLHTIGVGIAPAVGQGTADEFSAYVEMVEALPDLEPILTGKGAEVPWPDELSVRYAVSIGLAIRATNESQALAAFRWLIDRAGAEWVQLFVSDVIICLRSNGRLGQLAAAVRQDPELGRFVSETMQEMLA